MSVYDRIRRLEHRVKMLELTTKRKRVKREDPKKRVERAKAWLVKYLSGKGERTISDPGGFGFIKLKERSELVFRVLHDARESGFGAPFMRQIRLEHMSERINVYHPPGTKQWVWHLIE